PLLSSCRPMPTAAFPSARRKPPRRLTTQRLIIVSGKGGVGKSTVAAALALAASRSGLRTLVVEVSGRHDAARLLGTTAMSSQPQAGPVLEHVSVERHGALRDYLRNEVPGRLPAAMLARSKMFELFVDAAPGLGELLTIGKVCDLAGLGRGRRGDESPDLVVLDAPSSGQLVGMLTAPRTFGSIARVGPVARQAAAIQRVLTDPAAVAVVAVAAAEQMAVSETVALSDHLQEELGIDFAAVVVNKLLPARFSVADAARLSVAGDDPAVRTARWFHARARAQRAQLARLRKGVPGVPSTTLPLLFVDELDQVALDRLADAVDHLLA
ncbi:MAG: ArsA family ATPase, partial [Solirubrobacteraceae bacterium]